MAGLVNNLLPSGQQINGYTAYDPALDAQTNANNFVNANNANYNQYIQNMPQYQNQLNNAATDQGLSEYNQNAQNIDKASNKRGLLYSGLNQEGKAEAANQAANKTQNQISQNNQNLMNYANQYGNQVAQSNLANYQSQVNSALQGYQMSNANYWQGQQGIGGLMGGIGSMVGMFSDEKLKDGVKNSDEETEEFLEHLDPKSFSYKEDPEKKKQLGILAQDAEKSPMGKALIIETPKGKGLDIAKTLSAVLATQAFMNKRLKKAGA